MEKMLVDWYMLAMDSDAPNDIYVEKILRYADEDDMKIFLEDKSSNGTFVNN